MANVENLLKTPTFQQLPLRGHSVRSAFPLNGLIVTIDFPVLGAFGTNGPIVVLFSHTTSGLRFCLAQPSFAHLVFQEPVSILRYALSHFAPPVATVPIPPRDGVKSSFRSTFAS